MPSAMPVLPLVGSMMIVSGLDFPVPLRRVDHRPADAVFDAPQRVEALQFCRNRGDGTPSAMRFSRTSGRAADALRDVFANARLPAQRT